MPMWLVFFGGMTLGAFVALFVAFFFVRRWIVSSSIDKEMCEGLIARLAQVDKQRQVNFDTLEKYVIENDQLLEEKMRHWDVPDKI